MKINRTIKEKIDIDEPAKLYEDSITKAIPIFTVLMFAGLILYVAFDSLISNT